MAKKKFFISAAIDYTSERPHLGHVLEKVQADVLARYKRQQGFDVHFSLGLDQHGLKIQRYAQKANKKPPEFVKEIGRYFKNLWQILNISNDDFIQTTEKRHLKVAQEIIKKIHQKGDIYKGEYKGLYCLDCESYYLPKDLVNSQCPIHRKSLEMIKEEGFFFKMSKYQRQLLAHIQKNKDFIIPESRRNEILNRLKEPLEDLSISRKKVAWGIPFPLDKKFTIFVWLEALCNYLTTIDYPAEKFKRFWPADVHVIGKDIVWHHVVIWGSLLLSLKLALPKKIFIHGFITVDGQKMSKSLGNVIDPFGLVKKYGTDPVRYFLLREIPSTEDGDFTYQRFEERYQADLANGLGNLVARILTLVEKYGQPPKKSAQGIELKKFKQKYKKALEEFKFHEALEAVWQLISFCDEKIEQTKPWTLIEKEPAEFEKVLAELLGALKEIALLLEPFLPETSEKILKQIKAGKKGKILFPRLK